ncbi:MAG: 16S rRNA (cytosine(967)-C(5))-methyltransferase RsmB [Alicyclobacillus sp.]|nr:16S rRNA (cytosine(967)-C(5))-methyltransferase RsmB [Alicyclobacillus sp.]
MTSPARRIAAQVLYEVFAHGRYSNVALDRALHTGRLDERDAALCTEIVYGTLQHWRGIGAVLAPYLRRGLDELDVFVRGLLEMSVYQLAFLERVPAYAVVDDAVALCKQRQPRAAGFVNGVLRAYLRHPQSYADQLANCVEQAGAGERMGIRHSYPDWLVQRLSARWGPDRTGAMLEAGNERPRLAVRANRRRVEDVAGLAGRFEGVAAGATVSDLAPFAIRLPRGLDVSRWAPYREGLVTVQDEASQLIAPLLRPESGGRLLDLCAGMGTKTTQLLEWGADDIDVTACDIHAHKLAALGAACDRLGVRRPRTVLADARSLDRRPAFRGAFDGVLLDAPCSGSGVLRRRPEIRWRRTQADLASLASLQRDLLVTALRLVRPGGCVVYATCSVLAEENEDVLTAVLTEVGSGFRAEPVERDLPVAAQRIATPARWGVYVTPEWYGTDGFYMARIRRTDE